MQISDFDSMLFSFKQKKKKSSFLQLGQLFKALMACGYEKVSQ